MAFIVSEGSSFIPCPAGPHSAVAVDVVDLGMVTSTFEGRTKTAHKCRIVWQVAETKDDGKPFIVQKQYTASLHEKAALRKDLESWRGRPFTKQEAEGFDVETLIGVPCLLNVQHVERNGATYANVVSLMRLPKGMAAIQARDYVRVKDRTDQHDAPLPPSNGTDDPFGDMDDAPF
jgi:hypothetical protein